MEREWLEDGVGRREDCAALNAIGLKSSLRRAKKDGRRLEAGAWKEIEGYR
jgi:hypothetical protein